MITYTQLSLADIFSDYQEIYDSDNPKFLSLLQQHSEKIWHPHPIGYWQDPFRRFADLYRNGKPNVFVRNQLFKHA